MLLAELEFSGYRKSRLSASAAKMCWVRFCETILMPPLVILSGFLEVVGLREMRQYRTEKVSTSLTAPPASPQTSNISGSQ